MNERRRAVVTLAWLLCGWLLALAGAGCQSGGPTTSHTAEVVINGERFVCELATTPQARRDGMSGRDQFEEGGMLFVFPEPQIQSFWMYDCTIAIDVLFLDSRGYVTATHEMPVEPPRGEDESESAYQNRLPRYSSGLPAQFAIELPAGSIDRLDVGVEDRVELDLKRLKALAE